jgi:hypothetical protein
MAGRRRISLGRARRGHDGAGSEARPQNAGPTANASLESRNSVSEFELQDQNLLHLARIDGVGAPVKVRIFATEGELSGGGGRPESLAISEPTNLV